MIGRKFLDLYNLMLSITLVVMAERIYNGGTDMWKQRALVKRYQDILYNTTHGLIKIKEIIGYS